MNTFVVDDSISLEATTEDSNVLFKQIWVGSSILLGSLSGSSIWYNLSKKFQSAKKQHVFDDPNYWNVSKFLNKIFI